MIEIHNPHQSTKFLTHPSTISSHPGLKHVSKKTEPGNGQISLGSKTYCCADCFVTEASMGRFGTSEIIRCFWMRIPFKYSMLKVKGHDNEWKLVSWILFTNIRNCTRLTLWRYLKGHRMCRENSFHFLPPLKWIITGEVVMSPKSGFVFAPWEAWNTLKHPPRLTPRFRPWKQNPPQPRLSWSREVTCYSAVKSRSHGSI